MNTELQSLPTEELATIWKKEYERTTGRTITLTKHSRVSYVYRWGPGFHNTLKRSDFLVIIPNLKTRPDFIAPNPLLTE